MRKADPFAKPLARAAGAGAAAAAAAVLVTGRQMTDKWHRWPSWAAEGPGLDLGPGVGAGAGMERA